MIVDVTIDCPRGYVENCLCMPRDNYDAVTGPDDIKAMFVSVDGFCVAQLDGFAVIPMEEYDRLKDLQGENENG